MSTDLKLATIDELHIRNNIFSNSTAVSGASQKPSSSICWNIASDSPLSALSHNPVM